MVKRWRRLTRIINDELEKFKLNSSRCTCREVAPLRRKGAGAGVNSPLGERTNDCGDLHSVAGLTRN